MNIVLVDIGPELFWYTSNALVNNPELHLKHINNLASAEKIIFNEIPEVLIINADDKDLNIIQFIGKIRNHAFLRNIQIIVSTSQASLEFRKNLLTAGAGYVIYKNKYGYNTDLNLLKNVILWFINGDKFNPDSFSHKPVLLSHEAMASTFGRLCALYDTGEFLIENNMDLNIGDKFKIENNLLEDLGIKEPSFIVLKKDHVGRYYQYKHSYLCKLEHQNDGDVQSVIEEWIKSNQNISKNKDIKVVYFEDQPQYREELRQAIKLDSKFCARGFKSLENVFETLSYQRPHFVLINRELIEKDQANFSKIKDYHKKNDIFVITYDLEKNLNKEDIEKWKKDLPFALHAPHKIELKILESMVEKLIQKRLESGDNPPHLVFGKHSPYSRLSIHFEIEIKELSEHSLVFASQLKMNRFCPIAITSNFFNSIQLGKNQMLRVYDVKNSSKINHKCLFITQNQSEKELIQSALKNLKNNATKPD